ncbi:Alkaline ceramidase 3 [Actinomortierella wolfii]|nr:Alkaline ceramidase 3 [Actinomortierella wolfii]KAG0245065.1 Alkaline ceramidase 3 [Actinomortierella wolfii]
MIVASAYSNTTMTDYSAIGFWGSPTASDWCERNYDISFYVAEFFNTLSSFSMVLVGLLGMYLHWTFEKRFIIAFGSIVVVGIGSIAFHGTLLFPLQMLDEVPMVFTILTIVYCCVEDKPYRKLGTWFPVSIALYGLMTTLVMLFASGPEHHLLEFIVFQSSFAFVTLIVVSHLIKIYGEHQDQEIKRLWRLTFLGGLFSYGYWNVDFRLCHLVEALPFGVPNPQLHAWWHVGASLTSYMACMLICYQRALNLDRHPKIEWIGGVIPRVTLHGKDKKAL